VSAFARWRALSARSMWSLSAVELIIHRVMPASVCSSSMPKGTESGEVTIEDGTFRIPIEFLTQSRKPFVNGLFENCDRRPKSVVVALREVGQESERAFLDFAHNFRKGRRKRICAAVRSHAETVPDNCFESHG
jgi:hypothetical protein